MQAIAVRDRHVGPAGLSLTELPYPQAAENDVIVRVHAAGFTPGELAWAGTWTDRAGHDRTPSVPGHEVSGVVTELGYGTTGLTVGQRVFGLADWTRNGTLAEYVAIEARNLAPLPAGLDHAVAAGAGISGLTAWQALFDHAHLVAGQTVLIHGAAGGVGLIAVQLAREVGSRVIGTGRAIFFVVEANRSQLAELAQRLRDGRLTSNVGAVRPLAEVPAAFGPDAPRVSGKTIIRVTEGW
jgi:NADPH:quinone reductase-like Zn-dependent oxidoreductase